MTPHFEDLPTYTQGEVDHMRANMNRPPSINALGITLALSILSPLLALPLGAAWRIFTWAASL